MTMKEKIKTRIVTVYQNNLPNAYTGRISIVSGNMTIWSIPTGIVRTKKKDVKDDLRCQVADIRERHCL
jgi:hypothetical protein